MTASAERFHTGADTVKGTGKVIGASPTILRAAALAEKFAVTDVPILLIGATGTGKELFAECIHEWSGRRGELVDVNCGALPKDMVESLLFGHRRGAFTGAVDGVEGLIAAADGGTLFLDELSSLPLDAQVKLLRVLETGEVRRMGERGKRRIRFRVVAAVQEDFDARVLRGEFRLDLYQRVAGVVLRLPPLAERIEDLWDLCQHFAQPRGLSLMPKVRAVVERYPWPGNVRELKAAVERAGFLAGTDVVDAPAMLEAIELGAPPTQATRVSEPANPRRAELAALMARHRGSVDALAATLGVSRSTVYRRLREANLVRPPGRARRW